MKIIGVTGKSGTGKSTFSKALCEKLNCEHLDLDKICHEALENAEIRTALCSKFGLEILDDNKNIDRKKLGAIVFSDESKMTYLTNLSWSYMEKVVDKTLLQDDKFVVIEAILLPKSKYWNMCNFKILVTADDTERKNKVIERDNISEEYFNKRDTAAIDYSCYNFDYVLNNDYNAECISNVIKHLDSILT